ncbi:MAG: DUF1428 domain-containing protein [Candidatus Nanoarchaeia archaeon]
MGRYVDGFLLVVPNDKVSEYKKMAQEGAKSWMKHGALEYIECMGDDLSPKGPSMKHLYFNKILKSKPNETVWFSFIVYKSRKHRDEVNAKVMKEMIKSMEKYKNKQMPFDMKRFVYGGFKVMVEK